MKVPFLTTGTLLFCLALLVIACASPSAAPTPADVIAARPQEQPDLPTIHEILTTNSDYALFTNALTDAQLLETLQGDGPFTVFVVTNSALAEAGFFFSQVDSASLPAMMQYHVVPENLTTADLATRTTAETVAGAALSFSQKDEQLLLDNYAETQTADIPAANGTIHVIDKLLLPPETTEIKSIWGTLVADGRFTQLIQLLKNGEAMYTLRFQPVDAVLAPTDDAFDQLEPTIKARISAGGAVTRYYVLAPDGWPQGKPLTTSDMVAMGEVPTPFGRFENDSFVVEPLRVTAEADAIFVNEARVIEADVAATNGIIHVLDTVILPQTILEHLETP